MELLAIKEKKKYYGDLKFEENKININKWEGKKEVSTCEVISLVNNKWIKLIKYYKNFKFSKVSV